MKMLATFAIYAGIVVFALLFVLVVVPWLSRVTGASFEMVSIVTAALSFVVALASYLTVRSMTAKKDSAGKKE
jgi:membrane protein implicated in regulation of membrane protease activity